MIGRLNWLVKRLENIKMSQRNAELKFTLGSWQMWANGERTCCVRLGSSRLFFAEGSAYRSVLQLSSCIAAEKLWKCLRNGGKTKARVRSLICIVYKTVNANRFILNYLAENENFQKRRESLRVRGWVVEMQRLRVHRLLKSLRLPTSCKQESVSLCWDVLRRSENDLPRFSQVLILKTRPWRRIWTKIWDASTN